MALLEVEPLIDIIKLTIQTGYIKGSDIPMNLLLLAKPESAKTQTLKLFQIKDCNMTNNITQSVIASKILPKIENEGLKYLIIPDILNTIKKDYSTREGFINMIKSLMEEGITSLDSFNVRTNKVYNPAVRCGSITAITTESFYGEYDPKQQRWVGGVRQNWRKIGSLSRFIPFSYEYTIQKTMKIFEFIYNENYQKQNKKL